MTSRIFLYGALMLLVQPLSGCSQKESEQAAPRTQSNSAAPVAAEVPKADGRLIVAFGDSLYAGYNLAQDEGLAPALERALTARGITAQVVNAGVSGDTTAAGLQRLTFVLDGLDRKPDLVIVGLGGNDMLRGLAPEATRDNLSAILAALKKRGIETMLTGMLAAPNLGADYNKAFNSIYPDLAKQYDVPLYPFLLDGVLGNQKLMLPDGIHPNEQGVNAIVSRITPIIAAELTE